MYVKREKNPETLVNAKDNSILKLKEAAEKRKALGEVNDIFERIDTYLLNETASNIKWHKDCYGNFTKAHHIDRLEAKREKANCTLDLWCNTYPNRSMNI